MTLADPASPTSVSVPQQLPSVPAVAVLVPEFPSQTHVFFWREILGWRGAGATVDLLSTRRPPDDACRHEFADEARRQTHYLWPPAKRDVFAGLLVSPKRWKLGLKYVASLSESSLKGRLKVSFLLASAADLVAWARNRNVRHVHCHSFADAAHVCRIARLFGGPTYSLTLHGDLPVYGTDHKKKIAECSAVGCDGPHLVEQLVGLGYPKERVLPNWMGVNTDDFQPTPPDPTPKRLRLITVARLGPSKGHRYAVQAVGKLVSEGHDITYSLVGEGEERNSIREEAKAAGVADRVHFFGTLGEGDVRRQLVEHDAFVLPSVGLGEAGPISVMEAMACGLPVVASKIGATTTMIQDGNTGFLCDQQDVDGLAAALGQLSSDPAVRQRLGEAARRHAVEHFDSRQTSLRLFEHIRRWTPETFKM